MVKINQSELFFLQTELTPLLCHHPSRNATHPKKFNYLTMNQSTRLSTIQL